MACRLWVIHFFTTSLSRVFERGGSSEMGVNWDTISHQLSWVSVDTTLLISRLSEFVPTTLRGVPPSLKLLISRRDKTYAEREKRLKYLRWRNEVIQHENFHEALHLQRAVSLKKQTAFWNSVNSIARRSKEKTSQANISAEDFYSFFESFFQSSNSDEMANPTPDRYDSKINVTCL